MNHAHEEVHASSWHAILMPLLAFAVQALSHIIGRGMVGRWTWRAKNGLTKSISNIWGMKPLKRASKVRVTRPCGVSFVWWNNVVSERISGTHHCLTTEWNCMFVRWVAMRTSMYECWQSVKYSSPCGRCLCFLMPPRVMPQYACTVSFYLKYQIIFGM